MIELSEILSSIEFNNLMKKIDDIKFVKGREEIVLDKFKEEWRGVFKSYRLQELRAALLLLYELDLIKDIINKDGKLIIKIKR